MKSMIPINVFTPPKIVNKKKAGIKIQMPSATTVYAVLALPPMAVPPVVNIGIIIEASVPPTPANNVARDVNASRAPASELSAGTIPQ